MLYVNSAAVIRQTCNKYWSISALTTTLDSALPRVIAPSPLTSALFMPLSATGWLEALSSQPVRVVICTRLSLWVW